MSILYKTWTSACSCRGVAVFKRNCADKQGNQLTAKENHDCCSLNETLLQSELKMAVGNLLQNPVEGKQQKCGGGGGGGGGGKTIEMWWWWWENNRILWPENLYKCATFYLFLSLHFAPEELT